PLPFVAIAIISCESDRLLFFIRIEHPLESSGKIRTVLPDDIEVITDVGPVNDFHAGSVYELVGHIP
ncbi:hypothetical protein DLE01_13180, partial [Streptomyces sp. FT05W]